MTAVAELIRTDSSAPTNWKSAALGDIVRIVTEGISAAELATLPQARHYSLPAFDLGAGPEVGPGEAIKSNKTVVPDNCVLFSKLNPRIPRIWRVSGTAQSHSYCSTEFWPLVQQTANVDLDYLTQYLSSASFLGHPDITPSSSTNSHQRVDRKSFERFKLLLPPLDEQQRIAEVLRSVDDAIAASRKALEQSRVVQSSLITDLCSGHGYPMVSLGQILDDIRYGTSAKCAAGEENGQPVLRIPNVVNGRVEADDLKYATVSDADRQRYSLHSGDIVVVRTNGNPAYIGRSALIAVDAEAYLFASYLIRMRFDGKVAWPPYVHAALNS